MDGAELHDKGSGHRLSVSESSLKDIKIVKNENSTLITKHHLIKGKII